MVTMSGLKLYNRCPQYLVPTLPNPVCT
jgi:hypothetical protein